MDDTVLTELARHRRPLHRPHLDEQFSRRRTNVSNLYPEILALIFSYLETRDKGRAAQVCHAWRDASFHKSVWRGAEAKLHIRRSNASPIVVSSLVRRGIKKVRILSLSQHDGNALKQLLLGIKKIHSLNLSGCYMVCETGLVDALLAPGPFGTSLTKLDLSLCKNISDKSLVVVAKRLKSLEELDLGGCCNVTNAGLYAIGWGLKKLKRLNLRSCWHISDQGISHLSGQTKAVPGYRTVVEGNLDLEYLGLQDCQKLSDEALNFIFMGLKKLQSINLSFCINVSDSGLKYLAKLPELRELNLRACDNITDLGLAYLSEGGSRLASLDVSFCDKIGDQGLIHLSQGLYNLRCLSMSACQISDEGLAKVAETLHELETLNIGQCQRVTDKGLALIGQSLPNLRSMDLYGCPSLTKAGIENVRSTLPQLTHLNQNLAHFR